MPPDITQLSDEELQRLIEASKAEPPKPPSVVRVQPAARSDVTKLSDEQLQAELAKIGGAATVAPPPAPRETLWPRGADVIEQTPGMKLPTVAGAPPPRQLEYPDAPTTGHLPLPGIALSGGKDVEGNDGLTVGGKASTLFGTLLTDSPKARQEIYVEHLPGAEAHTDKYGNPMIRYQGKLYYTARPGEIDAMDAGRVALATAASVPAMAVAPASLAGASLLSGATMGGMSLAEDYGTRLAGGKSQPIDPLKAGISTAIGTVVPFGLGKLAFPAAGVINQNVRAPLTDAAITALGIDVSKLTPEIRQAVSDAARRTFGNPQAVQTAYRQAIAKEAGVDLTKGELTQLPGQMAKEKGLSGPGDPGSERVMQEFRVGPQVQAGVEGSGGQNAQLSKAQEMLRIKAGGSVARTPEEAGAAAKAGYEAADAKAKEGVDALYGVARDPFAVEAAGGRASIPTTHASDLQRATREALEADKMGKIALGDQADKLTPNAKAAVEAVNQFSASTRGPRAGLLAGQSQPSLISSPAMSVPGPRGLLTEPLPPGATSTRWAMDQPPTLNFPAQAPSAEASLAAQTAPVAPAAPRITGPSPTGVRAGDVNWNQVEDLRQTLVAYQEQAALSGSEQDQRAVAQVIKAFDDHFGQLNPLFDPGRAAHAERMSIFKPGGSDTQDKATKAVLTALSGPEPGVAIVKAITDKAKTGQAVQMIDHLQNQVFANQPELQSIIKEQMVRRLTVGADTGKPLTPRETVTAIDAALKGDAQKPIYTKLFNPEELAAIQRFRDLQEAIALGRESPNPSKSGLLLSGIYKHGITSGLGGAIGGALGWPLGHEATAAGTTIGTYLGSKAATAIPRLQAQSAVRPGVNYGVAQSGLGQPAITGGLLAGQANLQNPGPADRLMQNAYGLLGGP